MSKRFKFDDHNQQVIAALQNLLWKLMTANSTPIP